MNLILSRACRWLVVVGVSAPALLFAQGYEPDTGSAAPASESAPERRSAGVFTRLFNRPARTNATEQLAYARDLEARGKFHSARRGYKSIFLFWPTSVEAPDALLSYAKLLEKRRDYDAAFEEYQYLVNTYGGRFPYETVIRSQYAIANQVRTQRYGRWFFGIGFVSPERAIPYYYQVASNAPNWAIASEALFNAGAIFQEKEEYEEAISAYSDLQTRYPASAEAESSAYQMLQCMLGIARRQPNDNRQAADTRAALARYLRDHPRTEHQAAIADDIRELDARLARTALDRGIVYERAGKKQAAVKQYQELIADFPHSPQAETAGRRIEKLEASVMPKESE